MDSIMQALSAVFTAAWTVLFPGGRRLRLRSSIKEDLKLLGELDASQYFGPGTASHEQLVNRISHDFGSLARLPARKVKWSSFVVGLILSTAFVYWTGVIRHDSHQAHRGLPWYGWVTGVVAGLLLIGTIGILFPSSEAESSSTDPK